MKSPISSSVFCSIPFVAEQLDTAGTRMMCHGDEFCANSGYAKIYVAHVTCCQHHLTSLHFIGASCSITRDANNEWLCDPATIQEAFGTRDGREVRTCVTHRAMSL